MAPSAAIADAIFGAVERNLRNPTLEQLWGSPGTLPAAIHMFEWTGERRWSDLLTRGLTILWDQMEQVAGAGVWLWTQDLYRRTPRLLGGGRGFAGNVFPALRGAYMLLADLVAGYVLRTEQTLRATAPRDPGVALFAQSCRLADDAYPTLDVF